LHSLNKPDDPDRIIAESISKQLNVEHFLWEQSISSPDKSISLMTDFVGQTMLSVPVSAFLSTRFYSSLYKQNKIVIDGSYGEIARRRLFVNLLLRGKKSIYNKDYAKIIPLLKNNRPGFFAKDYLNIMQKGLQKHVENFCNEMPSVEDFGINNWIDLFALRTRLPNSSAPEQARSDSELINFMPFIQPLFLKAVFNTPVKERRNNKIFYEIINDLSPSLTHFPLVKDGVTYPFSFKIVPAAIWTKLKRKIGLAYTSNLTIQFIESLSEYIQDLVNSTDVRSSGFYNYNQIREMTDGFYKKKNHSLASDVDWWLSFETWRRTIQNN
jgi:hypothetical protein